MARKIFYLSLLLTAATLIYWPIAQHRASDFSNLSGDDVSFPTASFDIGDREFAWIVDRQNVLIVAISNPGGDQLPLLRRMSLVEALMNNPAIVSMAEPIRAGFGGVGVSTFKLQTATGTTVTLRLFILRIWILALLAALPAMLIGAQWAWKSARRSLHWLRLMRIRRARARLGRCNCGYDLRSSHRRCPECGRAIRLVRVPVPRL